MIDDTYYSVDVRMEPLLILITLCSILNVFSCQKKPQGKPDWLSAKNGASRLLIESWKCLEQCGAQAVNTERRFTEQ